MAYIRPCNASHIIIAHHSEGGAAASLLLSAPRFDFAPSLICLVFQNRHGAMHSPLGAHPSLLFHLGKCSLTGPLYTRAKPRQWQSERNDSWHRNVTLLFVANHLQIKRTSSGTEEEASLHAFCRFYGNLCACFCYCDSSHFLVAERHALTRASSHTSILPACVFTAFFLRGCICCLSLG